MLCPALAEARCGGAWWRTPGDGDDHVQTLSPDLNWLNRRWGLIMITSCSFIWCELSLSCSCHRFCSWYMYWEEEDHLARWFFITRAATRTVQHWTAATQSALKEAGISWSSWSKPLVRTSWHPSVPTTTGIVTTWYPWFCLSKSTLSLVSERLMSS